MVLFIWPSYTIWKSVALQCISGILFYVIYAYILGSKRRKYTVNIDGCHLTNAILRTTDIIDYQMGGCPMYLLSSYLTHIFILTNQGHHTYDPNSCWACTKKMKTSTWADKREHRTIAWTGVCNFYNQRIICFHKQLISAQGHHPHIIGVSSDNKYNMLL